MPTVNPQVQKARDLMPLIAATSDEHDEIRQLTKLVVNALIDGGFFIMLKTKSVGGMELKPSIFAQVTEAFATADGSTGWMVCQRSRIAAVAMKVTGWSPVIILRLLSMRFDAVAFADGRPRGDVAQRRLAELFVPGLAERWSARTWSPSPGPPSVRSGW